MLQKKGWNNKYDNCHNFVNFSFVCKLSGSETEAAEWFECITFERIREIFKLSQISYSIQNLIVAWSFQVFCSFSCFKSSLSEFKIKFPPRLSTRLEAMQIESFI